MQQRQFKVFSFDSSWYCQYELWKRDLRGLSSTLIHFWILHVDVTWMTSHIKLYSSYMFFTLEIRLTVLLKEKLFKGMIHMLLLALLFQCCTRLHSCRGQKIVYSSPCRFVCLRKYVILCMWNGRKSLCFKLKLSFNKYNSKTKNNKKKLVCK